MNIQKELSKGSSSLLVLSVLGTGDMYGYQIIKEIEQRSENAQQIDRGLALIFERSRKGDKERVSALGSLRR